MEIIRYPASGNKRIGYHTTKMEKYKALLVGKFENNWSLLSLFVDEMELAGSVASGEEAVSVYASLGANIVFVDAFLPGMSGFETARFIKEQAPSVKIIIVSEKFTVDFLHIAMELRLDGYITRDMQTEILDQALKNLRSGQSCFDSAITQMLLKGHL